MADDRTRARVRGEYLEMPGLSLTLEQATRFCGLDRDVCRRVLDALVDERFLCVRPDHTYVKRSDEDRVRPESLGSLLKQT